MATLKERQVQAAIDIILMDERSYKTSLNWAVNYCRAAKSMTGEELRVQVLYIISNLERWRHPLAGNVRQTLRMYYNEGESNAQAKE